MEPILRNVKYVLGHVNYYEERVELTTCSLGVITFNAPCRALDDASPVDGVLLGKG